MVLDEQQRFNRRPDPEPPKGLSKSQKRTLIAYSTVFLLAILVRGAYLIELWNDLIFAAAPGAATWIDLNAGRVIFALLGALACVLTTAAGRRFFDLQTGVVAGCMLAVYPPALYFEGRVHSATMSVFLLSALIAVLGRLALRPARGGFAVAGVILGLLTAFRPDAAAILPIVALWCLLAPTGAWKKRALRAGLFVVGAVVVMPATFGRFAPPEALAAASSVADLFHAREIGEIISLDAFRDRSLLLKGLTWWHFGVLAPLAVLGVWTTRKRWRWLAVLHGIGSAICASLLVFGITSSGRLPLLPPLALFAAAGLLDLVSLIQQRRRDNPLIPLTLTAVALAACNWPLETDSTSRSTTWLRLGETLDEQGDAVRAREALEESLRHTDAAETHVLLGEVLRRQDEHDAALGHFRHAAELAPGDLDVQRALALQATATGREEEALAAWNRIVEALPRDLEAHVQLGYFAVLGERKTLAEHHLNLALEIDPEHPGALEMLAGLKRLEQRAAEPDDAQQGEAQQDLETTNLSEPEAPDLP